MSRAAKTDLSSQARSLEHSDEFIRNAVLAGTQLAYTVEPNTCELSLGASTPA